MDWCFLDLVTHESNFRVQATFQLLLATIQNKSWRCWMMQHNQLWLGKMWYISHQKDFRMGQKSFEYPLNLIAQNRKSETRFRTEIAVQKRLAVPLSRLSTGYSYRVTSKVFGVGKSTILTIY